MDLKDLKHITYRRFLFKINDYFLCETGKTTAAINYYIQCSQNTQNSLHEFYTLLIDLKQDKETIWQEIQRNTRTEIRSFLENQNYEYVLLTHPSRSEVLKFVKVFNEFARYKNIRSAERERLLAYRKNKILALSFIRQNNELLCINFYRLTKERATNLHSFQLSYRLKEKFSQSHLGRAHRALHWLDIVRFKQAGVHYYDFCGWYNGNEDNSLLNINAFKEQFTRHKVKEYSGVIYKNKILLFLKNLR